MPLAQDLIAEARQKLLDFQTQAGTQAAVKKQFLDLWALQTNGLGVLSRGSIDMEDFAGVIDANRAELRPWVMVYGAAAGVLGPWQTIVLRWCWVPIPSQTQLAPEVEELLESLLTGYARLITN